MTNWIHYTSQWVKGEITQGKIMVISAVVIIAFILKWANFQQAFYKGFLMPVLLLCLAMIGYGSYQWTARGKHLERVRLESKINLQKTFEKEILKAEKDQKGYKKIKLFWLCLASLSIVFYFLAGSDFLKGLSLGAVFCFVALFCIDALLHQRLVVYYHSLQATTF